MGNHSDAHCPEYGQLRILPSLPIVWVGFIPRGEETLVPFPAGNVCTNQAAAVFAFVLVISCSARSQSSSSHSGPALLSVKSDEPPMLMLLINSGVLPRPR